MDAPYDYNMAGLDNFLSRSIDSMPQASLNQPGPPSQEIRYDGAQVSGQLGDVVQVGNILLDGRNSRIDIFDENGDVFFRAGNVES